VPFFFFFWFKKKKLIEKTTKRTKEGGATHMCTQMIDRLVVCACVRGEAGRIFPRRMPPIFGEFSFFFGDFRSCEPRMITFLRPLN